MYNKEQIDAEFMKTHGFRKKGTAFFRVLASEILQVVKTEKGRGRAEIQFGVFSLYSELLPQWLTSSGNSIIITIFLSHTLPSNIQTRQAYNSLFRLWISCSFHHPPK